MEDSQIIEGNKIISEFIGPSYESTFAGRGRMRLYFKPGHTSAHCEAHELEYHTSWDWLMPVIEKIENMQEPLSYVEIIGSVCDIKFFQYRDKEIHKTGNSKIEASWLAVVEFLKQTHKPCTTTNPPFIN